MNDNIFVIYMTRITQNNWPIWSNIWKGLTKTFSSYIIVRSHRFRTSIFLIQFVVACSYYRNRSNLHFESNKVSQSGFVMNLTGNSLFLRCSIVKTPSILLLYFFFIFYILLFLIVRKSRDIIILWSFWHFGFCKILQFTFYFCSRLWRRRRY